MTEQVTHQSKAAKAKPTSVSLYRRLLASVIGLTFILVALFSGLIYIAENRLEIVSLHHWLNSEAQLYQERFFTFGEQTPPANTTHFETYWSDRQLPAWLAMYGKGFHEHLLGDEDKHFLAFDNPTGKGLIYIVYKTDADDFLDEYEAKLHQQSLLLAGGMLLVMLLFGLYVVRMIAKPLEEISRKITLMQPDQPMFEVITPYQETQRIELALKQSKQELIDFFQREQEFHRFASHELRTPMMVMKGSGDLLAKVPNLPLVAQKAIGRLQVSCVDMEVLTDAFLLLGRSEIPDSHFQSLDLSQLLEKQLARLQPLFAKQGVQFHCQIASEVSVYAPPSFIIIVLTNLIKNAFNYSVNDISLQLTDTALMIENEYHQVNNQDIGYGYGLLIVERVCQRLQWQFKIEDDQKTYTATLSWAAQPPS